MTFRISPLMCRAQSVQRNTIGQAMSSGVATRPTGIDSSSAFRKPGSRKRIGAHVSINPTRRNAVYVDAEWPKLGCQRFRERNLPALRRRIVRNVRFASLAGRRTYNHDAAKSILLHVAAPRPGTPPRFPSDSDRWCDSKLLRSSDRWRCLPRCRRCKPENRRVQTAESSRRSVVCASPCSETSACTASAWTPCSSASRRRPHRRLSCPSHN